MNVVLWVLQLALAVKFLSVGFTHGLRPDPEKMERGNRRFGAAARPLLIGIAAAVLLCAVGLVLPALVGAAAWLVPWAAAVLAAMMLGAIGFHLACRDVPKTWASAILFALAALVAIGRGVIAPL
jgi:FtsH-binding integral membrane protein